MQAWSTNISELSALRVISCVDTSCLQTTRSRDWKKLKIILIFSKTIVDEPKLFVAIYKGKLMTWIDKSFTTYEDMKGHTVMIRFSTMLYKTRHPLQYMLQFIYHTR